MLYFVYAKIPSFNSSICNVLHTSYIFADNQNFFIFMQERNTRSPIHSLVTTQFVFNFRLVCLSLNNLFPLTNAFNYYK